MFSGFVFEELTLRVTDQFQVWIPGEEEFAS